MYNLVHSGEHRNSIAGNPSFSWNDGSVRDSVARVRAENRLLSLWSQDHVSLEGAPNSNMFLVHTIETNQMGSWNRIWLLPTMVQYLLEPP